MRVLKKIQYIIKKIVSKAIEQKVSESIYLQLKLFVSKIDWIIGTCVRYFVYIKKPIQSNKIMFMTFQGEYTCNCKYITEKLIDFNGIEIVWSLRKEAMLNSDEIPSNVKLVEQYTLPFYEEMASSKVWVCNSIDMFRYPVPKKKDQVMIETWHGALGIKKFDKVSYKSSKSWIRAAERCGRSTDYCISNSTFENNIYRNTYWQKAEIIEVGHPRNDVIVNCNAEFITESRKRFFSYIKKEDKGEKIVMYAPTFRDNHNIGVYTMNFNDLKEALQRKFGGEWIVLLRFHPTIRDLSKVTLSGANNIIDVTDYVDIQELILITDVGITDYSSWIFDFLLTRRPGFIYAKDYDNYRNERDFAYPLSSTPFAISTNMEELIKNIYLYDDLKYKSAVEEFLNEKGCFETGKASRLIAERICDIVY